MELIPEAFGQPITERVAAAAKDLGEAVSSLQEGESVVMDASTWEVEIKRPSAASSSPGQPEVPSEEERDWSGEDTDVEVVEALPASSSTAGAGTKDEIEEGAEDKTEVLEDAPKRRKTLRFGSAQIHILQAVAAADTANWVSLQQCILQQQAATPGQQTALLDRLEQLAEMREESRAGALEALEYHKRNAQDVADLEQAYQEGLDTEMARLERYNPVGPRSSQPLLTNTRLEADLAGGTGIWQARRNQRARERAARHRLAMKGQGGNPGSAGTLHDVPTEDHGTVLDMTMQDRAQEELREFRRELKAGGSEGRAPGPRPHRKDSGRSKLERGGGPREEAGEEDPRRCGEGSEPCHCAPRGDQRLGIRPGSRGAYRARFPVYHGRGLNGRCFGFGFLVVDDEAGLALWTESCPHGRRARSTRRGPQTLSEVPGSQCRARDSPPLRGTTAVFGRTEDGQEATPRRQALEIFYGPRGVRVGTRSPDFAARPLRQDH